MASQQKVGCYCDHCKSTIKQRERRQRGLETRDRHQDQHSTSEAHQEGQACVKGEADTGNIASGSPADTSESGAQQRNEQLDPTLPRAPSEEPRRAAKQPESGEQPNGGPAPAGPSERDGALRKPQAPSQQAQQPAGEGAERPQKGALQEGQHDGAGQYAQGLGLGLQSEPGPATEQHAGQPDPVEVGVKGALAAGQSLAKKEEARAAARLEHLAKADGAEQALQHDGAEPRPAPEVKPTANDARLAPELRSDAAPGAPLAGQRQQAPAEAGASGSGSGAATAEKPVECTSCCPVHCRPGTKSPPDVHESRLPSPPRPGDEAELEDFDDEEEPDEEESEGSQSADTSASLRKPQQVRRQSRLRPRRRSRRGGGRYQGQRRHSTARSTSETGRRNQGQKRRVSPLADHEDSLSLSSSRRRRRGGSSRRGAGRGRSGSRQRRR